MEDYEEPEFIIRCQAGKHTVSGQDTLRCDCGHFWCYDCVSETFRTENAVPKCCLVPIPRLRLGKDKNHECITCLTETTGNQMLRQPCGHKWCFQCVITAFRIVKKRDSDSMMAQCCNKRFLLSDLQVILPKDTMDEITQILAERTASGTNCHRTECQSSIDIAHVQREVAVCSKCMAKTCTSCKRPAHGRGECPFRDEATRETLQLAHKAGWRRCPACGTIVERQDGCSHMCKCLHTSLQSPGYMCFRLLMLRSALFQTVFAAPASATAVEKKSLGRRVSASYDGVPC